MRHFSLPRPGKRGFTLIELVMVIVVLGILAAVALPKFVDLSGEARLASVKTLAGAITSASAANSAAKKLGNPSAQTLNGGGICSKAVLGNLLSSGWPEGYEIDEAFGGDDCSSVAAVPCELRYPGSLTSVPTSVSCAR